MPPPPGPITTGVARSTHLIAALVALLVGALLLLPAFFVAPGPFEGVGGGYQAFAHDDDDDDDDDDRSGKSDDDDEEEDEEDDGDSDDGDDSADREATQSIAAPPVPAEPVKSGAHGGTSPRKPARRGPAAPRLASLSLSRRTARVCLSRSGRARRSCRPRLVAVVYSLNRAATVRARLSRRVCGRSRCRWLPLGTRVVDGIRGRSAFTIGQRFRGRPLRPGRYLLGLVASEDGVSSSPLSATFRVR